ncbi:hypothetical protein RSAG8_10231, partial [Rhizoctonia solani AG-8 WAC10335]
MHRQGRHPSLDKCLELIQERRWEVIGKPVSSSLELTCVGLRNVQPCSEPHLGGPGCQVARVIQIIGKQREQTRPNPVQRATSPEAPPSLSTWHQRVTRDILIPSCLRRIRIPRCRDTEWCALYPDSMARSSERSHAPPSSPPPSVHVYT